MPYYIDTTAGSGNLIVGKKSAVPLSEQAYFEAGLFQASDCYGDFGSYVQQGATDSGAGLPTAGGTANATYPGGFTPADLAAHPGLFWINNPTQGNGVGFGPGFITYFQSMAIFPDNQGMTFRYIINPGKFLSTPTDRFITAIGPFGLTGGGGPGSQRDGWYIEYTDSVNGGNWNFRESRNSNPTMNVPSAVPYVPNVWQRLEFNIFGTGLNVTITPCGTSSTQTIFEGESTVLLAGNPMQVMPASIFCYYTIKTTVPSVGPVMDYYSVTVNNDTGRSFARYW